MSILRIGLSRKLSNYLYIFQASCCFQRLFEQFCLHFQNSVQTLSFLTHAHRTEYIFLQPQHKVK